MMQNDLELSYEDISKIPTRQDELQILKSGDIYKELLMAERRPDLSMLYNSGEHEEWDPDYHKCMVTLFEKAILEHSGKRKVVDDDASIGDDEYNSSDDDLDPQYENFLGCLKECDNSYAIYVENGSPELLKYEEEEEEEETDSEIECVPKPRKMVLRSSMRIGLENLARRTSLGQVKETPAQEISSARVEDPDYQNFMKGWSIVDDTISFTWKNQTVVYGGTTIGNGQNQIDNDESDSDVELIENPASVYKDRLRQEVLTLLRKPYDDKEYRTLMQDIKKQKNVLKHKDLSGGREMFVPLDKLGKSLLDRNPDLKIKLERTDDLPTRLNLLRGFFFHIQHLPHEGIFCPWQDTECLSVRPSSC